MVKRVSPFWYEPLNERPQEDIALSVRFLWVEKKFQNLARRVFIHVEEMECVEPAARFQVKPLLYLPKGRKHRNDQRKKSFWHESILSPLPVLERAGKTSRVTRCRFARLSEGAAASDADNT